MEDNSQSEQLLLNLVTEYADMFNLDCEAQRQRICQEVQDSLREGKLQTEDLEKVSNTREDVTHNKIPKILEHFQVLQEQFRAIDKLADLVQRVTIDITRLEGAVTAAEQQLLGHQMPLSQRIIQPVIRHLDAHNSLVPSTSNNSNEQLKPTFDQSLLFRPSDYLNTSDNEAMVGLPQHSIELLDTDEIDTS